MQKRFVILVENVITSIYFLKVAGTQLNVCDCTRVQGRQTMRFLMMLTNTLSLLLLQLVNYPLFATH